MAMIFDDEIFNDSKTCVYTYECVFPYLDDIHM